MTNTTDLNEPLLKSYEQVQADLKELDQLELEHTKAINDYLHKIGFTSVHQAITSGSTFLETINDAIPPVFRQLSYVLVPLLLFDRLLLYCSSTKDEQP